MAVAPITCPALLCHGPPSDMGERSELTPKIVVFLQSTGARSPVVLRDVVKMHTLIQQKSFLLQGTSNPADFMQCSSFNP